MINEFLSKGKENCITRNELCSITGLKPRQITKLIEKERREGQPICASCDTDNKYGYYMAKDKAELQDYCDRLKHRAIEIFKTRKYCMQAIEQLDQGEGEGAGAEETLS